MQYDKNIVNKNCNQTRKPDTYSASPCFTFQSLLAGANVVGEYCSVPGLIYCRRLLLLSPIRSCLMLEASKQVCTSLLQPSFDYADVVWGEISEGCCKELHRLQNRAAWIIILRKNTSNDTFCVLNWLNLASRRKMHKYILVFKCLNNLVPKYHTQYFTRNVDLHNRATRRSNAQHPPNPKRNMGKRTFKYAWTIYFNSLPNYVKSAMSVNSFKKMLTAYFTLQF